MKFFARKTFAEINSSGAVRGVEISPIGRRIKRMFYGVYDDIPNPLETMGILTDFLINDRIYEVTRLKPGFVKEVIKQRLTKDLEFIMPSIEELRWVHSKYASKGKDAKHVVSVIDASLAEKLPKFNSLTFASQVIAHFVSGRTKRTFMLVHGFESDATIYVFNGGILDYVRNFETKASALDDNIELTVAYYKEQKKTSIAGMFGSGDFARKKAPDRHSLKPVGEILKVRGIGLSAADFSEFIVPIGARYTTRKVGYLYSTPGKGVRVFLDVMSALFVAGSLLSLNLHSSVNKKSSFVHQSMDALNAKLVSLNNQLNKVKLKLGEFDAFRKTPVYKYVVSARKPMIVEFLSRLREVNESIGFYISSLELSGSSLKLDVIIPGGDEAAAGLSLSRFLGLLSVDKSIESISVVSSSFSAESRSLSVSLDITLKESPYAGT